MKHISKWYLWIGWGRGWVLLIVILERWGESGPCPTGQCYRELSLSTVSSDCGSWPTAVSPFHSTDAVIPCITQSQHRWQLWLTSAGLFYCYWPSLLLQQVRSTLTKMFSHNTPITISIKFDNNSNKLVWYTFK